MNTKRNRASFQSFLEKVPVVELPIILSHDTYQLFSSNSYPLTMDYVDAFIGLVENEEEAYTEIIPCFSIANTYDFYAVVYWKAYLMDYRYVLATFSKKGIPITKVVIGGIYSDGEHITQSVATIDDDWTIHIASGQSVIGEEYDAAKSTKLELELLPDGQIISN